MGVTGIALTFVVLVVSAVFGTFVVAADVAAKKTKKKAKKVVKSMTKRKRRKSA